MRTKSRWRSASGLAAACVALGVLASACQPSPAEPKGRTFTVTGVADGLYPGGTKPLWLTIANPDNQTVSVRSLSVAVGTPNRRGCSASSLLAPGYTGPPVLVKAKSKAYVQVPVTLAAGAPQACQGATFPLTYTGAAVKPGTDLR